MMIVQDKVGYMSLNLALVLLKWVTRLDSWMGEGMINLEYHHKNGKWKFKKATQETKKSIDSSNNRNKVEFYVLLFHTLLLFVL